MADEIAKISTGQVVHVGRLSVAAWLQEWIESKVGLRESTRDSYERHLRRYLIPYLGHVRLADLRGQHFGSMLLAIRRDHPSVGPATERRVVATLQSAIHSAIRQRLLSYDPTVGIELRKPVSHMTTVWAVEHCLMFLAHVESERLGAFYRLAAMISGMRRGELIALEWDDLDDLGIVHFRRNAVQVSGHVVMGEPKTKHGTRDVPLDADYRRRVGDMADQPVAGGDRVG
jgi:integrase